MTQMVKHLRLLLFVFITVWCQCSDKNCMEPGDVSFSSDIQPIFTASCAISGCHDASTGSAGLVLTEGKAYTQLVDVTSTQDASKKRVTPGDTTNSYLVMKLEGRGTVGSEMPPGGTLSAEEIQRIKDWIDNGAEDN